MHYVYSSLCSLSVVSSKNTRVMSIDRHNQPQIFKPALLLYVRMFYVLCVCMCLTVAD